MVGRILSLEDSNDPYDVTDALAVAICHMNRSSIPGAGKSGAGNAFQEKLRAMGVEVDSRGRRTGG